MNHNTRRGFLGGLGLAAAATGIGGASAVAADEPTGSEVVPGRPGAPFSKAVRVGRLVFTSGVIGVNPGTRELASKKIAGQAERALENLKAVVEAAGSSMDRVAKCTCFLTDDDDFTEFNEIFRSFFPQNPPARSTVIVKDLVMKRARIEIECVAYLD